MGWAHGTNVAGREVGYGVAAVCDHSGCDAAIDRGLAYCCGELEGVNGEAGCGGYFCGEHLLYGVTKGARCETCTGKIEAEVHRLSEENGREVDSLGDDEWDELAKMAEANLYERGEIETVAA